MDKLIEWTSIFEICPKIDEQHKKLIEIINELHREYLLNISNTEKLLKILKELQNYCIYHFNTEEQLFKIYNYSNREEHTIEHLSFVSKIGEFVNRYKKDDSLLKIEMLKYLKKWLLDHILGEDKKYIDEICEKE